MQLFGLFRGRNPAFLRTASIVHVLVTALAMFGCEEQPGISAPVVPTPPATLRIPLAPVNLTVTASGGEVIELSWNAPPSDSTRHTVTGYRVEWSTDGNTGWTPVDPPHSGTGTNYRDSGLPPGTSRHYRVIALSAGGDSAPSSPVSATTNLLLPLAPGGLTAAASGVEAIELSWNAPPSDPTRHAVTGYRVEWSADGTTGWTPVDPPHSGTGTSYRDSGLPPGTSRHYRVIALSAGGDSTPSSAVSAGTSLLTPLAPTNLTVAVSGIEAIELSWDVPPSDPARHAVTGYRVEWSADGTIGWTPVDPPHSGTGTTYRDAALTPGTLRYYRVIVLSAGGESAPSSVVNAMTNMLSPLPPVNLIVTASGGEVIELSWNAPPSDSTRHAVTGYRVEWSTDGTTGWTPVDPPHSGTGTSYRDSGLNPGAMRYYRVIALSEGGNSTPSGAVSTTTSLLSPLPPVNLGATADGAEAIELSWTAPPSDPTRQAVTGYRVEWSTDGNTGWTPVDPAHSGTGTSYRDSGLNPGAMRYYRVIALSEGGNSTPSGAVSTTTSLLSPLPPVNLGATADGAEAIELSWSTPPSDPTRQAVTGYRVEWSTDGNTGWTPVDPAHSGTDTSYRDSGLTPGTSRHYRVIALSAGGDAAPSSLVSATTSLLPPLAPGNLTVTASGVDAIELSWSVPPSDPTRQAVTGYRVEWSADGSTGWMPLDPPHSGTDTSYRDSGLPPGSSRHYRVIALSASGDGTVSSVVSAATGAPGAPPPIWVFAGNVPEAEQTMLREELEYSRAYFADKFGITATGFTVLVGENYRALAPVYRNVVGTRLSNHYHPQAKFTYAWVTSSTQGSAVLTLMYGLEADSFSSLKHYVAHEYFHVLQGQLASGFAELPDDEIGWHIHSRSVAPQWLVEGLASYADHQYTPSRSDRRPFLHDRYTPFEDLGWFQHNELLTYGDLAKTVNYADALCGFAEGYFYPLSFAATFFLAERAPEGSYVEFWRLLGEHSTWQRAFDEAFGISVNDFYEAFGAWLPAQLPSFDQVTIEILWPDMDANPPVVGEFLYLYPEHILWEANSNPEEELYFGSRGQWNVPLYLTITYPAGANGMVTVSLWWSPDQITHHLLGWYKDGQLTDQRDEATPITITGVSQNIEWALPAHPNTLPRLETRRR